MFLACPLSVHCVFHDIFVVRYVAPDASCTLHQVFVVGMEGDLVRSKLKVNANANPKP
jgi:hypothetical protein